MKYITLIALALCGCTTYKNYSPSVKEPVREITVLPKVLLAVFDGRGNREGNVNPAAEIEAGLLRTYPNALERSNYFDATPAGRVKVRIRVQELGSQFGSRLVGATAISHQFSQAFASASSGWDTVVAQAQGYSTGITNAFAAEGWWVGTAFLEINIQDKRRGNIDFTYPLAAEHRESNMLGYSSASAATKAVWNKVSAQLFSQIDSILMKAKE